MKKFRYIIPVFILLLVSACRAEFAAYLEGDTVLVTDEPQDTEPITELVLGRDETVFVNVRGGGDVDFATSDAYIVRTDSIGALIAAKQGSTRVKIFYDEDKYVQLRCTVKNAPDSVEFETDSLTLTIENTSSVRCAVNAGAAGYIQVYSRDEGVAVVNADGTVTAVGAGETELVAEAYNGAQGVCHVTVEYPAPAAITGPDSLTGYAGESAAPVFTLEGGYHETLAFESLTPYTVAVDASGCVTFVNSGEGALRVTASGGAVKDVSVTVYPGSTAIAPARSEYTLYTGGTAELTAVCTGGSGRYAAVSRDESVISADGTYITAVGEGSATVDLVTPNGAACEVAVTVLRYPLDLSLRVEDTCLAVGETARAEFMDGTQVHLPIMLSSSDTTVCSVDGEGLIRALAPGEAQIILESGGVTQTVTVTVMQPASQIYFEPDALTLAAGDSEPLNVKYVDGGGRVAYVSSDETVARIENGTLTAVGPGTATVTAALSGGATAELTVTVHPALTTLQFADEKLALCAGDVYTPELDTGGDTWSLFSWSSSEARVAEVRDGVITARGAGEAVITVSAAGGVSASLTVNVTAAHEALQINAEAVNCFGSFTHYLSLSAGGTYQLEPECCRTFTCATLDPEIAGVTEDGLVTALKSGTAKLVITAACGARAVLMVEVK